MLRLFGRRNDDESDSDSDTSYTEDIFTNLVATNTLHGTSMNDIEVQYYFMPIRNIIHLLHTWCFNRTINVDHKNTIKEAIIKSKHLMSTIQIVRDSYGNTRVINGQHRIKAIQEIIKGDLEMEFDMNVMFEVYNVPIDLENFDEDQDLIEWLFKQANNNLNVKLEDDHEMFCRKVIQTMMNEPVFKKGLVDKPTGTVHRPRLLTRELYEALLEHLPVGTNKSVNDVDSNPVLPKHSSLTLCKICLSVSKIYKLYVSAESRNI